MRLPLLEPIKRPLRRLYYKVRGRRDVGVYGPGHFYSPIPDRKEIEQYLRRGPAADQLPLELPGIDLRPAHQKQLLEEYAQYYGELPFCERPQPGMRYYYENDFFSYADAIFLYSFLRHFRPRRVIEVGSGFSSALMLDTAERFLSPPPQFTFIEPYPERLKQLLTTEDWQRTTIIEKRLQDVPFEIFASLEAGDFLFIDSSHVVKCGSDVQRIFFDILPAIKPGVFVHFHDVFYPFEYPAPWLREGRFWNEDYFLRVFLYGNCLWEVVFFNTFIGLLCPDFLQSHMPLTLRNIGGSLYLRRKDTEFPPATS